MAFMMLMKKITSLGKEANKSQTSTCYSPLATVSIAEKQSITSLLSMDAITGKCHLIALDLCREVSHPNLIEMLPISAKGFPECTNIA